MVFLRSVYRLLVTATAVPSSPILVTLMKEALNSSETSVLTRVTRHNIPEDTILHSLRRENLKSYISKIHFNAPSCMQVLRFFLLKLRISSSGSSASGHFLTRGFEFHTAEQGRVQD
jgi:hypothetical protein